MSQVTLPSLWALLLCACAERRRPSCHLLFFASVSNRKCRQMQDTTSVNLHLRPFPSVTCSLYSNRLCQTGQRQARPFGGKCRRRNTRDRKPCPHDNDGRGSSVTVAGKRSFPPCPLRRPFHFPRGALRHPTHFLLFPSRLSKCIPMSPCRPFQTASVVIFVAGAKVKTGLGTQIF